MMFPNEFGCGDTPNKLKMVDVNQVSLKEFQKPFSI
jgi:hypothetical protein